MELLADLHSYHAVERHRRSARTEATGRSQQFRTERKRGRMTNPPRTDQQTTLQELRTMVRQFVDARDWKQFHAPKNISMAMAIEVAELMEHFQWLSVEASREMDATRLAAVGEELADVLCYGFALANELDLDISTVMRAKMKKNEAKYPVESYRGRYEKPPGNGLG